jgi:hypothetical protein
MSRGNVPLFKNSSEGKAKIDYIFSAAICCGFFFRLQQFLVVGFSRAY